MFNQLEPDRFGAEQWGPTMFCATVLYPWIEGKSFDTQRYARDIAPRYALLLGDNCIGYEVRVGRNAPGQPHLPYCCLVSFWLSSAERFGAALGSPDMAALMAEIRSFSDIEPIRQFDEVLVNNLEQALASGPRRPGAVFLTSRS